MNALGLLIAFATTVAPAPQPEQRWTSKHQLRNIAAADAAETLGQFAATKRFTVVVSAEPVTNTVRMPSGTC